MQCYMCDWFAFKQYSTSALKCSTESYSHIDKTKFKIIGRGVLVSKGETKQEEEWAPVIGGFRKKGYQVSKAL